MRIRIQLVCNADPDPNLALKNFLQKKLKKFSVVEKNYKKILKIYSYRISLFFSIVIFQLFSPWSWSSYWTRIRIRIQEEKWMRIHADLDPHPQPWYIFVYLYVDIFLLYWLLTNTMVLVRKRFTLKISYIVPAHYIG